MESNLNEQNSTVLQSVLLDTLKQLLELKQVFIETKEEIWNAIKIIGINEKEFITVEEFALLLSLKTSTVYKKSHERKYNVYKLEENGKLSYFKRSEIEKNLEKNKISSIHETDNKAIDYIFKKK